MSLISTTNYTWPQSTVPVFANRNAFFPADFDSRESVFPENQLFLSPQSGAARIQASRAELLAALQSATERDQLRMQALRNDYGDVRSFVDPGNPRLRQQMNEVVRCGLPFADGTTWYGPAEGQPMTTKDVVQLQNYLAEQGYDCGPAGPDGKYGKDTHNALQRFLSERDRRPELGNDSQAGFELDSFPGRGRGADAQAGDRPGALQLATAATIGVAGARAAGSLVGSAGAGLARAGTSLASRGASILASSGQVGEVATLVDDGARGMLNVVEKGASVGGKAVVEAGGMLGRTGAVLGSVASKVAPALAVGMTALEVSNIASDNSLTHEQKVEKSVGAVGSQAGAWVGATQGMALGASLGTLCCPGIGTAIGTVVGGAAGGIAGSYVGRKAGELVGDAFNWVTGH